MPIRISGKGANPECPLCKTMFIKTQSRGKFFYVCLKCEISINVKDPAIFLWHQYKPSEKEIICPNEKCGCDEMRFFFRTFDDYMKAYCPRCHSSVEVTDDLPLPKELIKKREIEERGKSGSN